ncbi:MAG: PIN domain nuclease [Actinomycetia bacterium]|nr:PIN domain nuclease [Actinomycetes bacterium]
MNLVDSSVWIDYLRGVSGRATDFVRTAFVDADTPAITEPIAMELLAGASPSELSNVERLTDGLPSLPIVPELDYRDAAALYRVVRADGRTVRRLNDCLIAAIAIRHDATLVHKDADFEAVGSTTSLRHLDLR